MKKYIQYLSSFLFCILLTQVSYAQTTPCVETDECFEFIYNGPTFNANGTVTLDFSVTVNCDHDLSYAAFELPAGAKASNYSPKTKVENATNNPYNSIKFEMQDGIKNGKTANFSYTITAAEFATLTTIRAEAKASTTVGTVSFNAAGCGGGQQEEPICIITTDEGLFTFGYMGTTVTGTNSTVRFSIDNNTATAMNMVMIEVLDAPASLTPVAPAGFTAELDADGIITYTRVDGTTTGNETVIFGFTLPTENHALMPFYTLTVFTEGGDFGTTGFNTITCDDQPINPLGVELSSFEGKATASGITLAWTTASEENNDRFEVQRSTDGKAFTTIGTVKGAGNSSASLSYSFTDSKTTKGANYYRINQVDFDGTATLSKVIAIESNGAISTTAMSLYPNPATNGNVNIALAGDGMSNKTFAVIITDMNGRTVFQQEVNTTAGSEMNIALDQSKIAKGLYMVKVQGNNLVATQKLIVR